MTPYKQAHSMFKRLLAMRVPADISNLTDKGRSLYVVRVFGGPFLLVSVYFGSSISVFCGNTTRSRRELQLGFSGYVQPERLFRTVLDLHQGKDRGERCC